MAQVPNKLGPTTFAEVQAFAETISKSGFCPKEYKEKSGDIIVAIQLGAEVGLAPLQALQNIAVINGKPSIYGDSMLALVKASGLLGEFSETYDEKRQEYTCVSVRKDNKNKAVTTFSMDDARRARLAGKQGPWSEYPKRMLQMRARGFNLRDNFPDVLKGLISREEAQDYPVEVNVTPVPRAIEQREHIDPNEDQTYTGRSDLGGHPEDPDICPHFANPDECTICKVNTVAALPTAPAAEDESQEQGGTADSHGRAASAPPPTSPVGTTAGGPKSIETLSIEELEQLYDFGLPAAKVSAVLKDMYKKEMTLNEVPRRHFKTVKARLEAEAKKAVTA